MARLGGSPAIVPVQGSPPPASNLHRRDATPPIEQEEPRSQRARPVAPRAAAGGAAARAGAAPPRRGGPRAPRARGLLRVRVLPRLGRRQGRRWACDRPALPAPRRRIPDPAGAAPSPAGAGAAAPSPPPPPLPLRPVLAA